MTEVRPIANRRLLYAVLFAIFIGPALLWSSIVQVPDSGADAEQAIRSVVTEFGEQLQRVSLLANKEELQQQIRAAYAPYVSDELLSAWLEDPTTAPGRLTSSPWPDCNEITGDEDAVRAGHHIPPCDDGFAACFVYVAGLRSGNDE